MSTVPAQDYTLLAPLNGIPKEERHLWNWLWLKNFSPFPKQSTVPLLPATETFSWMRREKTQKNRARSILKTPMSLQKAETWPGRLSIIYICLFASSFSSCDTKLTDILSLIFMRATEFKYRNISRTEISDQPNIQESLLAKWIDQKL